MTTSTASWTLYGSPISLFTRKLEAALECYGIEFENRRRDESNRAALEARSGTHQIPVLTTPFGWTLNDSTPIMFLLDALFPARRLFPPGAAGVLVHLLEEVLDEWVARVMVHYRWHYAQNTRFVISAIEGVEVDDESARRHPLAQWGPRACRATGTADIAQQRAAEREYTDLIAALETQLGNSRFALGERPTAVDVALMGGLRGHTLHDPIPDLCAYPRVCAWATAVPDRAPDAELAPFPHSTPFARHLLTLARDQYQPFVLANRDALSAGTRAFTATTWGEPVSYLARAYPETSRQMLRARITHQLDGAQRAAVMDWLAEWQLTECVA